MLSWSCFWKADPSQQNSGVTGPCGHFSAWLYSCGFGTSGFGQFCLASSFPGAPCLIFQLGDFLCWLVESKGVLLYSPHFQILKCQAECSWTPWELLTQENTGVEPSIVSMLWKDNLKFFFSSVHAFCCFFEDSIFSVVVLCYFNSLIPGTSWTFHWKCR